MIKLYPGGSVKKKTSSNPNIIAIKLQNINIKRNAGNRNNPTPDIKHNECCDKILNNFEDESFFTECFIINFLLIFPKDLSNRGYQMKLFLL